MHRVVLPLILCLLFSSCQGTDSESDPTTGNFMEIEPEQSELDEIALAEQPEIIQDFFAVGKKLFGTNFCYDYTSISQLILHNNKGDAEWSQFEVNENYLTIYHKECDVLLEFMTFEMGGYKKAFLSQMTKGSQQFNYLRWSTTKGVWINSDNYPRPTLDEYFINLNDEEMQLVTDYGADFVYINPYTSSATYVFSEWAMQMNMGEKQNIEFDKEVAVYYELSVSNHLRLNRELIHPESNDQNRYLIACFTDSSESFDSKLDGLLTGLSDYTMNLSEIIVLYGSTDFRTYFPPDTSELGITEQFEPRDGFWFYKQGKNPLEIDANETFDNIALKASFYFDDPNLTQVSDDLIE